MDRRMLCGDGHGGSCGFDWNSYLDQAEEAVIDNETLYSLLVMAINRTSVISSNNSDDLTGENATSWWMQKVYPSGYTPLSLLIASVFVTIIMVIVVGGNVLVIIAIATEKSLKGIQNWFIASLAVADCSLGVIVMPFSLANEMMGYWVFGQWWCDVHSAIDVLLCTSSIMNICLISLDRYWSITHAIEYLRMRTPALVAIMITVVWILSGLISIPPLLGWKKETPQGEFPTCQLSSDIGYVLYSALGSFYIPSCIMVFVYIQIYFAARNRSRRQMENRMRRKDNMSHDARKMMTLPVQSGTAPLATNGKAISPHTSPGGRTTKPVAYYPSISQIEDDCYETSTRSEPEAERGKIPLMEPSSTLDADATPSADVNRSEPVKEDVVDRGPKETPHPSEALASGDTVDALANAAPEGGAAGVAQRSADGDQDAERYGSQPHLQVSPTMPTASTSPESTAKAVKHSVQFQWQPVDSAVHSTIRCSMSSDVIHMRTNSYARCQPAALDAQQRPIGVAVSTASLTTDTGERISAWAMLRDQRGLILPRTTRLERLVYRLMPRRAMSDQSTVGAEHPRLTKMVRSEIDAAAGDDESSTGSYPDDSVSLPDEPSSSNAVVEEVNEATGAAPTEPVAASSPTRGSTETTAECGAVEIEIPSEMEPSSSESGVALRCTVARMLKIRYHRPGSQFKKSSKAKRQVIDIGRLTVRDKDPARERRRLARHREKRATLILGLIMGAFILCWLPFFFLYLLSPMCQQCNIQPWGFAFAFWLGYINSALNPVIYTIFNRDFRRAFRRIIFRCSLAGR